MSDILPSEYPEIAFDHFLVRKHTYFVSHVHTGLSSVTWPCRIYCSQLTKCLLLAKRGYGFLSEYLHALSIGQCFTINYSTSQLDSTLDVVLLQAGHCIGSTMFLIRGTGGTILYTGDFRLSVDGVRQFQTILPFGVDTVYLDTTFFHSSWRYIPSRETAAQTALSLISRWLKSLKLEGDLLGQCMVYLYLPAQFGYEYLLETITSHFGTKVYLEPKMMQCYAELPKMSFRKCLCFDPRDTWLHVRQKHTHYASRLRATGRHVYGRAVKSATADGSRPPNNVLTNQIIHNSLPKLTIIPTAIWFGEHYRRTNETVDFAFIPSQDLRDQTVRLFYGTHSSEHEITELVLSIKPKKAVACCAPPSDTLESVQSRLDALVTKLLGRPSTLSTVSPCQTGDSSELLSSIRRFTETRKRRHSQEPTLDDDDFLFA
ncbi:DNA cross-link repair 1C protein [Paragonimus heterotremus]|uniref:DNA cross-link repair 1C protein n=1 Tax=Paragonimus heterotremus TaxID=100268 RepID=A0A8J4WGB2_9TREM|nr:DNA cross-link repair 1C protein [Paragonimus heterotremus]